LSSATEKELDAFLAGLPSYQRKFLELGLSSLTPTETDQFNEWFKKSDENLSASDLRTEDFVIVDVLYKCLLSQVPARLKERRERETREIQGFSRSHLNMALPRVPAGRPLDSKAQDYFEQYSGDSSYADIAKQELQQELQSVPDAEAKAILIEKESERIRQSVRRSKRRKAHISPRT
jgi:hypothetical protein